MPDRNSQIGYKAWSAVPERRTSREFDYGVNWLPNGHGKTPLFSSWRVSWIKKTGELYATPIADRRDRFVLLGNYPTIEDVEAAMADWEKFETDFYQNLTALFAHLRRD